MHQANGDTRLCTACIDHVDLVAVGRAVLRETGRKDLKLGGKRRGGSPPLPPRALHRLSSSSGHGCTLAESTDVRTERDREERERERERERNGSPRSLLPRIRCAHTGNDAFPRLYVACTCTRVCFFNEIYYRTPNASRRGCRRFFPPIDSHPPSLTANVAQRRRLPRHRARRRVARP